MPRAFLHFLRAGAATNCSSSHSVIYLPGTPDALPSSPDEYEWDFALASRAAKLPYVSLELEAAQAWDEQVAAALGLPKAEGNVGSYCWSGPAALLHDVAQWVLRDGVVALGGPDYGEHHLLSLRQAIDPSDFGYCRVRRDPLGFWTVVGGWGGKLRLSFSETDHAQVQPFRSTWPELVDLKITDCCEAGCAFCYQDSRPDGAHARLEDVLAILDALEEAQVLEVVLGGGEPTRHPDFPRVLAEVQRRSMRVAFTTRRLDWHEGLDLSGVDLRQLHWGYSLQHLDELPASDEHPHRSWTPTLHVVMGTELSAPEPLREIAEWAASHYADLVLLGFKPTGRAAEMKPLDDSHWLDTCHRAGARRVSIDATLAAKYDAELTLRGIPTWLYEVEDGRFSMHVDAVRGLCAPSSFCAPEERFALPSGPDAIRRAFDRINEQLGPARFQRHLELEQLEARELDDQRRLVLLDAAMEGRCERCGEARATRTGGVRGRPLLLCPRCRGG